LLNVYPFACHPKLNVPNSDSNNKICNRKAEKLIRVSINIKLLKMSKVVIRHKVGDFDTWLKGHQDRVKLFSKFGSGFQTFQDTDDPNSIVLVAEVFDLDGMQTLMNNPEAEKMAKEKHTVLEPITVSMPVSV